MEIKSSDVIHLENVSKHIATAPLPLSSKTLLTIAQSLSNALNLCIKYIDKEPVSKSPPPLPTCPNCLSANTAVHEKPKSSLYCPECFKTFPDSTGLKFCPTCIPPSKLISIATSQTRYRCKDCNVTFKEGVGVPTDFNKYIYFCHLIYNTDLCYNDIIRKLKISSDTYYRWKKRLAIYYPDTRAYLYGKRCKK